MGEAYSYTQPAGGIRSEGRKRREKARKKRRQPERIAKMKATPCDGWTKHTEFHWSRQFNGKKLDYWPTSDKFQYEARIYIGDPIAFMEPKK